MQQTVDHSTDTPFANSGAMEIEGDLDKAFEALVPVRDVHEPDVLQALAKKIDEQNAKIDTLSQQILKLEQQISNMRPGVMIGEATPVATPPPASSSETAPPPGNGNTHTVARGETLTSIAKMHGVTVSELQKLNHIENDRKLQIGQTIMIPGSPTPAASPSPGE